MNLIGTKELETKRLILRKINENDYKKAYENWCSDDNVSKYVTWSTHKDINDTKKVYDFWIKEYEKDTTFRWIIELKDTNDVIGTIDVVNLNVEQKTAEIGYCSSKKYWNNGYMTEAFKKVIEYLFKEVGVYTIYADHMKENVASGKVMQKSGLTYEGILRSRYIDKEGNRQDLVSYSIIKDDYNK